MIASPYSIPSSKKALEVIGTSYYVPTASPKTLNATRDNRSSSRVMSITREQPQSSAPQTSSNTESSNSSTNSNSSTLIYVPVSASPVPAQPFGVPLVPVKPATPTFSVGMKNDKHK